MLTNPGCSVCVVMTGLVVALLYLYHASSRPPKLDSAYTRVPPPPPPPPRYRHKQNRHSSIFKEMEGHP